MFRLLNNVYYAPEGDAPAGGGGTPPIGGTSDIDDDIKFLGGDDEQEETLDLTPPKKEKKGEKPAEEAADEEESDDDSDESDTDDSEEEESEEDDELADLEEELTDEEPSDDKLELTTPVRRKEILKKYPNLFKDFPYLEKAYYREQQFTELLPTIDDAREAVESKQTLERFEKDLMGGNVETILAAVKDQDTNSFYRIVDELLPTLAKVDEGAYHHLLGNVTKHTIAAMVREARSSKNDVLQSAAQILNQFVFGSSDYSPPTKLAKDEKPEEKSKDDELTKRQQEFTRRQFESARTDLNQRINNTLKATIEGNIDPRGSMTDFVKRHAVRQVQESMASLISQDKRFGILVDKLWEHAFKKDFDKESVDRIRSAYLSKARTLLPSVIKKARIEALRGMGKRVRDTEEPESKKGPASVERPRSKNSGKVTKPGDIPKGMRTLDFLMQD